MPKNVDKFNAIEWLNQFGIHHCAAVSRYCEHLSLHGSNSLDEIYLINAVSYGSHDDSLWICVEKTKERQETRSFEVYILRNNEDMRATNLIAAVCKADKQGRAKVNYRSEIDQAIRVVNPRAKILHV